MSRHRELAGRRFVGGGAGAGGWGMPAAPGMRGRAACFVRAGAGGGGRGVAGIARWGPVRGQWDLDLGLRTTPGEAACSRISMYGSCASG